MPTAVSRALAISADCGLLLLPALAGPALAAKSPKTAAWICGTNSSYAAAADARNAVDESNETNNTATQAFPSCG